MPRMKTTGPLFYTLDVEVPPGWRALAAYLRLSKKKTGVDYVDTETQLADSQAVATTMRGIITRVYVENDTSAFKKKRVTLPDGRQGLRVRRDVFQALYEDLYDGAIQGMVGYHLDRIARQPRDLEDLIDLVEMKPAIAIKGAACDIDLTTDGGILMARTLVNVAEMSSRDARRRVTRKWAAMQEEGKPGGGPRPFGFKKDRISHDPKEAALIVAAVDSLLAGGTLADVCRDWNKQGAKTTVGNAWTTPSIKALLKSPRIAGIRARRVKDEEGGGYARGWEIVLTADGNEAPCAWEAIVPRDKWEALQVIFDGNTARYKGGNREVRKFLLSGICRCGACGARMVAQPANNGRTTTHNYICPSPVNGGCGKVSRHGKRIDDIVSEAVKTAMLANLSVEVEAVEAWGKEQDLADIEQQLADAYKAWKVDKLLTSSEYFPMRRDLEDDRKKLAAEKAEYDAKHAAPATPVNLAETWEDEDVSVKRPIVERFIEAVVIHPLPVRRGGAKVKKWDASLIEVVPKA